MKFQIRIPVKEEQSVPTGNDVNSATEGVLLYVSSLKKGSHTRNIRGEHITKDWMLLQYKVKGNNKLSPLICLENLLKILEIFFQQFRITGQELNPYVSG
jgi:hypothetical protein